MSSTDRALRHVLCGDVTRPSLVVLLHLLGHVVSFTVYNQPTEYFHPYDTYERGFLADPDGYETRNTYQASLAARSNAVDRTPASETSNSVEPIIYRVLDESGNPAALGSRDPFKHAVQSYYDGSNNNNNNNDPDRDVVYRRYYYTPSAGEMTSSISGSGASREKASQQMEPGLNEYTDKQTNYPSIVNGWRSATGRSLGPSSSNNDVIERYGQERYSTKAVEPVVQYVGQSHGIVGTTYDRPVRKQAEDAILTNSFTKLSRRRVDNSASNSYSDPCSNIPDGDYPLSSSFRQLLPHVSPLCNFVKCSHRTTFVNACGPGSRNPDYIPGSVDTESGTSHYCSLVDTGGFCRENFVRDIEDKGNAVPAATIQQFIYRQ